MKIEMPDRSFISEDEFKASFVAQCKKIAGIEPTSVTITRYIRPDKNFAEYFEASTIIYGKQYAAIDGPAKHMPSHNG